MSAAGASEGEPGQADLCALAVEAAHAGAELLLERFARGEQEGVRSKSTPTDLVSEADLSSQRAIRVLLAQRRPHDAFVGEEEDEEEGEEAGKEAGKEEGEEAGKEEGEEAGKEEGEEADAEADAKEGEEADAQADAAADTELARASGERDVSTADGDGAQALRWIVDPLDGTVNFLFGIPQWCVSVAVQDGAGRTLAGAIVDPCRGETWSATADGNAALNGRAVVGSARDELASAMVATGLYYDAAVRAEQGRVLADLVSRVRDIRRFGSAALDLAWTAAGRYDAYFERGVKLWDVAAGELICERAGLEVLSLEQRGVLPAGVLVGPRALAGPLMKLVG